MDLSLCDALLSRLFHDLASPASAVANGSELLGEMIALGDTALATDSLELTTQSANTVTQRLTFFRMAFGGAGTTGDVTLSMAVGLARDYVATREHGFASEGLDPSATPGLGGVKLMLNAVMVVTDCLSRPGAVSLVAAPDGSGATAIATGPGAKLSEAAAACLDGTVPRTLDTRIAPVRFFAVQAERFGIRYEVSTATDRVSISVGFP